MVREPTEPQQSRQAAGTAAAEAASASADWLRRAALHDAGLWSPDVVLVRGAGALVYDAEGNEYIDCLAGIAVATLGHANPRLVAAISQQAGRLISCLQSMGSDVRTDFVDKLFEFLKPPLKRVFLANSGAEANEGALKWARVATGRKRFVASKQGFSGRTMGVLPLTWEPHYREPFEPFKVEVDFAELGDLSDMARLIGPDTAGVMLEPIQGESGINVASPDYLRGVRELCDRHGALLILDEIQSGVGRTGTFLASEESGVADDIVTLAKGLAGGVPIGAVVMTDKVALAMPKGGHGTTFGGNPLAAAAGLAVLQEIEEKDLMRRARELGEHAMRALRALASPLITEVRGRGLMIGVELSEPAGPVVAELKRAGVLATTGGSNVIRLLPPLIIGRELLDDAVSRLGQVLAARV